jgi:hypothetical protein
MSTHAFPCANLADSYEVSTRKLLVLSGDEFILVQNASGQISDAESMIIAGIRASCLSTSQETHKL